MPLARGEPASTHKDHKSQKQKQKQKQKQPKPQPKPKPKLKPKPKDPNRFEWGLLPEISYSSDTGVGFGFQGSLVRYKAGYWPFQWRLRAQVSMSAKAIPDSSRVELPVHSHKLSLDLPGMWRRRLRLGLGISFRRSLTVGYYGIGNSARRDIQRQELWGRYHQYQRTYPGLGVSARLRVWKAPRGKVELFGKLSFSYNWIDLWRPEDAQDGEAWPDFASLLAEDLAGASGDLVRRQIVAMERHGHVVATTGVIWDSRDHVTAPLRGMVHDLSLRGGFGLEVPFGYGGVNATARFYQSLYRQYLVVAARFTVDLLFGRPPLYELARHGGLKGGNSTGGGQAIRGVVAQRFHGKVKLLANFELRSKLLPFRIKKHRFNLGAVAFVDLGRVWVDYRVRRTLDGPDGLGFGFHTGLGGGLRLQWGEDFIIAFDVAHSPTDDNLGIYVNVNHVF